MRKRILNILKYIIFLGIGIVVFWLVYKNESVDYYKDAFKNLNYFWIAVSVIFSIFSIISRAVRWNMLIRPLGYRPRLYNTFLSILSMYFINLLIPRAGEVFRCTILSRYEKIPFAKLAGTVVTERMADLVMLVTLVVVIIASQLGVLVTFFDTHPEVRDRFLEIFSTRNILIAVLAVSVLLTLFILFRKLFLKNREQQKGKLGRRLQLLKRNFVSGVKSVAQMENKWLFIGHTAFIFTAWLFMLYVVFLAYEPTSHLSLQIGMITFLMGGLAMLAPVQGGIGPWHFMVYETLFIYGIDTADGKVFALIAHTTTNLIYLVLGLLALLIIPLVNAHNKKPDL
ncbi:MAG: flippase-like domain-containing protein [Bacteroidales bacterium]|nr:flippase-like domain-containing protein [Bacteroidales bacterium]